MIQFKDAINVLTKFSITRLTEELMTPQNNRILHDKIAEILVRNHMPTRQGAISEIVGVLMEKLEGLKMDEEQPVHGPNNLDMTTDINEMKEERNEVRREHNTKITALQRELKGNL